MKTQQERQAEKKREKLEAIEQQIKEGTLVVRKMTDEERAKFPPPDPSTRKKRYRR
jgi:hypothetical protein